MPRLTQDQLDERLKGIVASEMPAIAGVDPYRTALEVYLIKVGELDPEALIDEASRGRMERGHRLEDVALQWDKDIRGDPYERVNRTVWHPRIPYLYCHPDARRKPWTTERRLIEVKTSSRKWTEIPRNVEVQVQTQMACTGAYSCDVILLTFDGPPYRETVERDEDLISALLQVAETFWDRVQRLDPPPMDGSPGASHWLNTTRWKNEPEFRADADQTEVIRQLLDVKRKIATFESEEERLTNVIKFSMAGAGRMYAPGVARVIWTAPTVKRYTKWKEVAADYRHELEWLKETQLTEIDFGETEGKWTTESEPSRTFTVRESED
jgi:putative phage-type endonuclease